jgi:hypothetical protein
MMLAVQVHRAGGWATMREEMNKTIPLTGLTPNEPAKAENHGPDCGPSTGRAWTVLADSSCYAALHDASHEACFLRQLLDGLGLPQRNATLLHCDNDAAQPHRRGPYLALVCH